RFEVGRNEQGNALNRAHRRKFLLSELLVCGECGGGYTIIGKDRYGCAEDWSAPPGAPRPPSTDAIEGSRPGGCSRDGAECGAAIRMRAGRQSG
ncbi:MAG TPA: hypothetical protein VE397_14985, partial [Stellaceae bacterium]|nr:hypothetical protein [Stellaceae bacterium]